MRNHKSGLNEFVLVLTHKGQPFNKNTNTRHINNVSIKYDYMSIMSILGIEYVILKSRFVVSQGLFYQKQDKYAVNIEVVQIRCVLF